MKEAFKALGEGDYPRAMELYNEEVQNNPANLNAWCLLGNIYAIYGQMEHALFCYDQAVKLAPEDPRVWANRGVILRDSGRFQEAKEAMEKALSLDPSNETALKGKNGLEALLPNSPPPKSSSSPSPSQSPSPPPAPSPSSQPSSQSSSQLSSSQSFPQPSPTPSPKPSANLSEDPAQKKTLRKKARPQPRRVSGPVQKTQSLTTPTPTTPEPPEKSDPYLTQTHSPPGGMEGTERGTHEDLPPPPPEGHVSQLSMNPSDEKTHGVEVAIPCAICGETITVIYTGQPVNITCPVCGMDDTRDPKSEGLL